MSANLSSPSHDTSVVDFDPVLEKLLGVLPMDPPHVPFETEIPPSLLAEKFERKTKPVAARLKTRIVRPARRKWLLPIVMLLAGGAAAYMAFTGLSSVVPRLEAMPDPTAVLDLSRTTVSGNELTGTITDSRWETFSYTERADTIRRLQLLLAKYGIQRFNLRDLGGNVAVYPVCANGTCFNHIEAVSHQPPPPMESTQKE